MTLPECEFIELYLPLDEDYEFAINNFAGMKIERDEEVPIKTSVSDLDYPSFMMQRNLKKYYRTPMKN